MPVWHKTVAKQAVEKEKIQVPAYLRFQNLVGAKKPCSLPLPEHYQFLASTFDALESVYVFYKGRGQELEFAFDRIKKAVSNITNRYDLSLLCNLRVEILSAVTLGKYWPSSPVHTKSIRPELPSTKNA